MLSTTVVLVGICNDNPMLQTYLGTFCKDRKIGMPIIFNIFHDGIEKCSVDVYQDRYTFREWCKGHGLEIVRESGGVWRFYTGLHAYDSGSSGLLINGGYEMESLYRKIMVETSK